MGNTLDRKSCRTFYCRFPFGKMALFLPTMTRAGCEFDGADSILQSPRRPQQCVVLYFCSWPSRSGLFISKIVPVPKFHFPGKDSWQSVLIKNAF